MRSLSASNGPEVLLAIISNKSALQRTVEAARRAHYKEISSFILNSPTVSITYGHRSRRNEGLVRSPVHKPRTG